MLVDAILQTKGSVVYTVSAAARVSDAVAMLNRHNIGAVLVVDGTGEVAGIISERDIVRLLGRDPAGALARPVSECMTTKIVTCTRDTPIAALMEQMTRFRIRHIPIVENGQLMGIVSIGDVVKRKIEETEQEAKALREYIAT
ncbi:MAG TPA: CBS domain-containing protein [Devosiaceae bacterium]|jgi:CBS domain-containing protein|nr:CBS domain-containing protein [Devosiaceae bacterium]